MTVKYLKRGKSDSEKNSGDAKIRNIVESALSDIQARGGEAVRELSKKFDDHSPERFRLAESEIESLVSKVPNRDLADIRFAQEQIRNFARAQRNSMKDIEIETMPGVVLGHKNIPVQSVGCYIPGGNFH